MLLTIDIDNVKENYKILQEIKFMANINFLENEVIEFKKTTGELKEGIISIVSILNKHQSGKLYFGIKDNGEIIG